MSLDCEASSPNSEIFLCQSNERCDLRSLYPRSSSVSRAVGSEVPKACSSWPPPCYEHSSQGNN
ncbi:hypothetical protein DOTSEDRAFT_68840, partial [Dothistroma septosporum NZE10]